MQTHVLLQLLLDVSVSGNLVLWERNFIIDKLQRVLMNGVLSDELVANTGAPQGCILSPILFSIYTNQMQVNSATLCLMKYADVALAAFLLKEDALCIFMYFQQVLALQ